MNKLISIVIPVYNCEKTIEKCINSVLMQTYKNFELILVNDGSNDNSKEICQKFCLKYNNIYFIDQKNNGVSKARNRGIEKSNLIQKYPVERNASPAGSDCQVYEMNALPFVVD